MPACIVFAVRYDILPVTLRELRVEGGYYDYFRRPGRNLSAGGGIAGCAAGSREDVVEEVDEGETGEDVGREGAEAAVSSRVGGARGYAGRGWRMVFSWVGELHLEAVVRRTV